MVRRDIALSENEVRDVEVATNSYIYSIYAESYSVIYFKYNVMGKCSRQSVNRIVLSSHCFPS